jgi:hypothetical protein
MAVPVVTATQPIQTVLRVAPVVTQAPVATAAPAVRPVLAAPAE